MKRILIAATIALLCVSCGTSRFTFDKTENTIVRLGGKYDRSVHEEIVEVYDNGGIEAVINTVYQPDYKGGDPYVVVEGYLGEDAFDEFNWAVKEKKLEIEKLMKGVDLGKDEIGGNEGLALAVLEGKIPEGLVIEALGGMDKKNTKDFKYILDQKMAIWDELRTILDEFGVWGIKEALVNEEYTEEDIETYLGKSTLDDAKLMFFSETGLDAFERISDSLVSKEADDILNLSPEKGCYYLYNPYSYVYSFKYGRFPLNSVYRIINLNGSEIGRWLYIKNLQYYSQEGKLIYRYCTYDSQELISNPNLIGLESYLEFFRRIGIECYYSYENGKCVSESMSVLDIDKEVSSKTYYTYDEFGNSVLTVSRHSDNCLGVYRGSLVTLLEYDVENRLIHNKDSHGFESWYEYNDDGSFVVTKTKDGVTINEEEPSAPTEIARHEEIVANERVVVISYSDGSQIEEHFNSTGDLVYHYSSADREENWIEYGYYNDGSLKYKVVWSRE